MQLFKKIFYIIIILSLIACKQNNYKTNVGLSNNINIAKGNISDVVLDSNAVASFLENSAIDDSCIKEVKLYYSKRNYRCIWLNSEGLTIAATNFITQLQNYKNDFQDKVEASGAPPLLVFSPTTI